MLIGKLPLKRRISTTVRPIQTTNQSKFLRYATTRNLIQRQRYTTSQPWFTEEVTIRPRRPPIVDYDYYEDEDLRVVQKTQLNSKLFLTNKGNIRCLDQGNFPHPFSCKKFIVCARMVNGQVIGTEYSCPNKLSFDPVGGICNWSAGLGCEE